jgi:hypothetical protein
MQPLSFSINVLHGIALLQQGRNLSHSHCLSNTSLVQLSREQVCDQCELDECNQSDHLRHGHVVYQPWFGLVVVTVVIVRCLIRCLEE